MLHNNQKHYTWREAAVFSSASVAISAQGPRHHMNLIRTVVPWANKYLLVVTSSLYVHELGSVNIHHEPCTPLAKKLP